jgi:hypothetical protein
MNNRIIRTNLFASVLALSSIFAFTSCDRTTHDNDNDTAYGRYRGYVVSVRDTSDRYYDRNWDELQREYEARKAEVDKEKDRLDDKAKAEYNDLEADWQEFKARYDERHMQRDNEDRIIKLRSTLVATPSDLTFGSVGGTDMRATYERFIETVRANRETYSTQDWNEVNAIYNALKARRQAVMDEIPKEDKMRIQNLEIEYETKVMVNKPFSPDEKNDNTKTP